LTRTVLTVDKLALYQTGADTLMGKLLRRFWHPVALTADVKSETAHRIRVLGEDLTLYRGRSGRPYLIAGQCAHRCSVLHTGIVEDEQIRCMYHGWRYNGAGLCTEMPAEKKPRTIPVHIVAYPVREYGGLFFAYLGQAPIPEFDLPRKDFLENSERQIVAKCELWDCNWFQQVENSMDALHLNFAHMWGATAQFGSSITVGGLPDLSYSETSSGIRQTAERAGGNVRISDWTFPNNNHVVTPALEKNDPWAHVSAWPTPMDDTRTLRFKVYSVQQDDPVKIEQLKTHYGVEYNPADHITKLFQGDLSEITEPSIVTAQDYVAIRGQGVIYDRSQENLSSSDAGIIFLRKIFLRELNAIRDAQPTKQWRRMQEAAALAAPPVHAAE
jgi:5,5'-dehydrodivanillate O-demethylase